MNIREIIRDILDDKEINRKRQDEFFEEKRKNEINFFPFERSNRGRNTGLFPIFLPQLIGIVIGLALARIINGSGIVYIFLGIACALAFGTWKSFEFDKIGLKYAFVRNLIIAVPLVIAVLIVALPILSK